MRTKKPKLSRTRLAQLLTFMGYEKEEVKQLVRLNLWTPDCTYNCFHQYWITQFSKYLSSRLTNSIILNVPKEKVYDRKNARGRKK
jgi:hypothetical protein